MKFKDQRVWVLADDAGRPVRDAEGRAEMKYRETDPKSYRPALGNLLPDDGAGETPRAEPRAPRAEPRAHAARAAAAQP